MDKMTFENFKHIMNDEFQGMDPELDLYYWNLWNDTLRSGAKTGVKPCFNAFISDISEEII